MLAACNKHELKSRVLIIIKIMKINHSYKDFVAILHDGKIPLELKIVLYIKGTLEYMKYSQVFCT